MVGGEAVKQITIDKGATVTAELLKGYIAVDEGYEVVGFYTNQEYTDEFDFTKTLDADATIYARIGEIPQEPEEKPIPEEPKPDNDEKDDVPKTGVENYIGIAVLAMVVSAGAFFYTKKRD